MFPDVSCSILKIHSVFIIQPCLFQSKHNVLSHLPVKLLHFPASTLQTISVPQKDQLRLVRPHTTGRGSGPGALSWGQAAQWLERARPLKADHSLDVDSVRFSER